ncbi:MAG: NAD-dependent epimerase/dehydratase family protein [Porticoccaceae bacterium]|nr:NAD-dependent epimerase/dehydratase family protein [Porticoccaceae bacterium]
MKTILVTGGSGFIGRHFCAQAVFLGFGVIVISRDVPAAKQILPDAVQVLSDLDELSASFTIDVIVNLAGEPLAKKRWSKKQKQLFYTSRGDFTKRLFNFFALRDSVPEILISGSAVGYYGSKK